MPERAEQADAPALPTIAPLTGVRGLAASWVVIHHVRDQFLDHFSSDSLYQVIHSGYLGVDLFAFLSGFIIAYSYGERLRRPSAAGSLHFLWLRFIRTYPVHFLVLVLFAARFASRHAQWWAQLSHDGAFLRQLFLVTGWGFDDTLEWNVPAWSLGSEWFCYLCFPLLAPVVMRVQRGRTALLAAVVTLGATGLALRAVGHPYFADPVDWPLIRIGGEFLTGCWLYRLHASGAARRWPADWLGLIALLSIVWTTASSMHPLLTLASFALLVFSLAQETRWFGWLFSNRVSVYLGEISYSVYMVHWLLLSNYFALKMQWWWGFKTNIGPLIAAQFLLSVLAVASLTYALVENPARRRLRRGRLTRTLAARAGHGGSGVG